MLADADPVADAVPLPLLLLSEQAISSMLQPITPTPTARTRFTSNPFAHVRRLVAPSRASTGRAVGYRSQQVGIDIDIDIEIGAGVRVTRSSARCRRSRRSAQNRAPVDVDQLTVAGGASGDDRDLAREFPAHDRGHALVSCFSANRAAHSLRERIDTSTSVALARSAPTSACAFGVRANGSQLKNRHAFCQVILSM